MKPYGNSVELIHGACAVMKPYNVLLHAITPTTNHWLLKLNAACKASLVNRVA